jgi:predicted YcjX-like family ATPase
MGWLRVKTTECRIGVVGLYNAGKTVFLTSLLNHLESHDPDRFRLGDPGTTVRKFEFRPPDEGWSNFTYAPFRDALVHGGRWPDKTTDRSMAACQFERSDWTFSDALVKLYDLPGERLADAAMAGRSFAEWSDHLLELIRNDTPYRTNCAGFLEELAAEKPTERSLIDAYKLALAKLILAFKPMISPSTFLLDTSGSAAKPNTPELLAASRRSGLSAESEFAPLSAEVRAAQPELAAVFSARYERYKADVVQPFLMSLKSCHSLVVLVDVTMLLAGGVGMYDDNRQILRDLFHVLDPGETGVQKLGRNLAKVFLPHDLRPGWINRVAFVAPKLDLVHPTDRDRMLRLLKSMVGKLAENRDGLKYEFFNCAAVVSTKLLPGNLGERKMVGVPYRNDAGKKIPPGEAHAFAVSELPDDWPVNWRPGDYAYPEVYPAMPARKDCPPEQINLDKVFDFVLE